MIGKNMILLGLISVCLISAVLTAPGGGGGDGGHKKVTIHIPIHEKTIKHTHTKYVTVYHDDGGKEEDHHDHYHSDPFGGDHHH